MKLLKDIYVHFSWPILPIASTPLSDIFFFGVWGKEGGIKTPWVQNLITKPKDQPIPFPRWLSFKVKMNYHSFVIIRVEFLKASLKKESFVTRNVAFVTE